MKPYNVAVKTEKSKTIKLKLETCPEINQK